MTKPDSSLPHQNTWLGKISNIFLIYSPLFNRMRNFKDRLFWPISELCFHSHIPPWCLSVIGLLFGLASIAALFINYWYFVILMSISLIFDFIDGSVARYSAQESEFGKYFDFVIDHMLMILMVIGLCYYLDNFYWLFGAAFFSIVLYINIIKYTPTHNPSGRITLFLPCLFGAPQLGLLLLTLYGLALAIIMLIEKFY